MIGQHGIDIEITLTGPAGCGKSTLAARLAAFLRSQGLPAGSEVRCFSYLHEAQSDGDCHSEFTLKIGA